MDGHELDSIMLYIHPPLAIIGYALIFLFAVLIISSRFTNSKLTRQVGASLWIFTFLGLLTGMIWAQMAWGSYWSWDPKETLTLALFITVSATQIMYFEKRYTPSKWLAVLCCILTVLTAISSYVISGLHSFS